MAAKIFCCYAREDEALLNKLWEHLIPLQRDRLIELWHDRDISAGAEWEQEIKEQLNSAQIILLLVSPAFMASDYVNNVELKRAIERHDAKEARVIPIILRPVYWQIDPLRKLQALPTDGTPVTSAFWYSIDEAFLDVAKGIRKVIIELSESHETPSLVTDGKSKKLVDAHVVPQSNAAEEAEWTRRMEEERQRRVEEERARQAEQAPMASQVSHPAASTFRYLTLTVTHATRTGFRLLPAKPLVLAVAFAVIVSAVAGIGYFVVSHHPGNVQVSTLAPFTYRGHTAAVVAVAWSPDGKRITSGSDDGTVQVWDASTGARLVNYHEGYSAINGVTAVAWSPDSQHIASGSTGGTVQVWDASTGKTLLTYTGHTTAVNAVAWSPDGRHIASASGNVFNKDTTVQVWDASTGKRLLTYTGHTAAVNAVAWSPDGTRIASGSDDGTVQVWDASTGANIHVYASDMGGVGAMAWSPDGTRIAVVTDHNIVEIWDASTGKTLLTYRGHTGQMRAVAWSPDGTRIASGSDDETVQVWDASTGKTLLTYRGHTAAVTSVAWSPDGKWIASGSDDDTVQVWTVG